MFRYLLSDYARFWNHNASIDEVNKWIRMSLTVGGYLETSWSNLPSVPFYFWVSRASGLIFLSDAELPSTMRMALSYNYYSMEVQSTIWATFHKTCHQWQMIVFVISYWNPCFWLVISKFVTDCCHLSLTKGFVKRVPHLFTTTVKKPTLYFNKN